MLTQPIIHAETNLELRKRGTTEFVRLVVVVVNRLRPGTSSGAGSRSVLKC